tara:strand:+ start:1279 stop:2112 length:834 start_codon:yes stop_codon:yes gene_type:complete
MGYVGNQTTTAYTSMTKQDITGDGTSNYTLSHAVANANEIEVYINNVRQEPTTAYSASGTALTMTGTVASSDNFYVVFQGKAVGSITPPDGSVGTAQLADGAVDLTSKVTGVLPVANGGNAQPQVQTHLKTTSSQAITANTRANISGLNAQITPSSMSKRIKVTVRWNGEYSSGANNNTVFGIKRDSTDIGNPPAAASRTVGIAIIAQGHFAAEAAGTPDSVMYSYIDSPTTTSEITYHATFIHISTGTLYNQRTVNDTNFNYMERLTSSITLEEID